MHVSHFNFKVNNMTKNIKKNAVTQPKDAFLEKEKTSEFPLGKSNFRWMAVSAAVIVIGFLLMLGGSSSTEFNSDIFSTRRIVVGPTLAFLGFVAMGISIIRKPRQKS